MCGFITEGTSAVELAGRGKALTAQHAEETLRLMKHDVMMIKKVFDDLWYDWNRAYPDHDNIELPETAVKNREPGTLVRAGWEVSWIFGEEGDQVVLQMFASHLKVDDWHLRIYEDGSIIEHCVPTNPRPDPQPSTYNPIWVPGQN